MCRRNKWLRVEKFYWYNTFGADEGTRMKNGKSNTKNRYKLNGNRIRIQMNYGYTNWRPWVHIKPPENKRGRKKANEMDVWYEQKSAEMWEREIERARDRPELTKAKLKSIIAYLNKHIWIESAISIRHSVNGDEGVVHRAHLLIRAHTDSHKIFI